jgi:hypothetical protein
MRRFPNGARTAMDDVDQAADWSEKEIDERDLSISIYLRFVVSKDLRASPRWAKLARKLNLQG